MNKIKIACVVDDDEIYTFTVKRIIARSEIAEKTIFFHNGKAALDFFVANAQNKPELPDLILLDNWLTDWKSDANGQQLSKELKSNPKTSHIPVIIVSAVSNIEEIAEAGQADGYLRKPFDLTDLIAVVNKFLP